MCIAYAFPPINRSGTHRTLGFVRHLDNLGWAATVVTVEPKDGDSSDEGLTTLVPDATRVVRTGWSDPIAALKRRLEHSRLLRGGFAKGQHGGAGLGAKYGSPKVDPAGLAMPPLSYTNAEAARGGHRNGPPHKPSTGDPPDRSRRRHPRAFLRRISSRLREWASRLLITPDSRIGWIVPGVRAALREIRRARPDVLYSTSPYMSAHLIALFVSTWTHIPWVADFRDPWRGNPFRKLGFRTLDLWDALLEWLVLRRATHVICNTPTMQQALVSRRRFVVDKCSTILNGFDPERFSEAETDQDKDPNETVLLHCGQFYGPRNPRIFFAALRRAIELDPIAMRTVRMELLGPDRYDGVLLTELATEEGVEDRVRVLGEWTHRRAIGRIQAADALLLAGSMGEGAELQIPNKLFEYLFARKPIVATLHDQSPVISILRDADAQALWCAPNDVTGLARAMIRLVQREKPRPGGVRELWGEWSGVDRFARHHRGGELADVFTRVSGVSPYRRVGVLTSAGKPRIAVSACSVPVTRSRADCLPT